MMELIYKTEAGVGDINIILIVCTWGSNHYRYTSILILKIFESSANNFDVFSSKLK